MAFTSNSGGPMADINVTPLVDVMLCLLIIFMVTVPPLSYPIQVDLPQPTNSPPPPGTPPDPIRIRIDAGGSVSWNGSPTPLTTLPATTSPPPLTRWIAGKTPLTPCSTSCAAIGNGTMTPPACNC